MRSREPTSFDSASQPDQLPDASQESEDDQTLNDAISDQLVTDERIQEMGLGHLLDTALARPADEVKSSLSKISCGRDSVEWERGVTGLHVAASPTSGALVILFTDRIKNKYRGSQRNGSIQKMVIEMGSLWSAWLKG